MFWGIGYSLKMEIGSGVLESNWMTPVPRLAVLAGRTLTSLVPTTLNCAGVRTASWLLFGFTANGSVTKVIRIAVPMLAGLFGVVFAGLARSSGDANTVVDVSNFLVAGLSGSGFPVTVLPRGLLEVSLALRTACGFDVVRSLILGIPPLLALGAAAAVLGGFMVVMLTLGWGLFCAVERLCRARGTLGIH